MKHFIYHFTFVLLLHHVFVVDGVFLYFFQELSTLIIIITLPLFFKNFLHLHELKSLLSSWYSFELTVEQGLAL